MEKKEAVSKIIGTLINGEFNTKEVIEILEEAKNIYFERSWHFLIDKKNK